MRGKPVSLVDGRFVRIPFAVVAIAALLALSTTAVSAGNTATITCFTVGAPVKPA